MPHKAGIPVLLIVSGGTYSDMYSAKMRAASSTLRAQGRVL